MHLMISGYFFENFFLRPIGPNLISVLFFSYFFGILMILKGSSLPKKIKYGYSDFTKQLLGKYPLENIHFTDVFLTKNVYIHIKEKKEQSYSLIIGKRKKFNRKKLI